MLVLIENTDMPKSCFDCPLSYVFPVNDDVFIIKCAPLNRKCSENVKRNDCPLVEEPELKHGKWERQNDGIMIWWECSECHHDAWYDEEDLTNFCPNCGTRMDGDS